MQTVLKILSGSVGLLFLYIAVFLYEDEEGAVQNWLEEWWIRLMDKQTSMLSKQAQFLREVAGLGSSILRKVFGTNLLSIRSIGVSICLSMISMILVELVMGGLVRLSWDAPYLDGGLGPSREDVIWTRAFVLAPIFAFGALALVFVKFQSLAVKAVGLLLALMLAPWPWLLGAYVLNLEWSWLTVEHAAWLYALLVISFAADFGFVALTRQALQWCSNATRVGNIIGAIGLNCAASLLLCIFPFRFHFWRYSWEDFGLDPWRTFASLNVVDAVVGSLFAMLAVAALAHRLIWPTVCRGLFVLQRVGIARRRKLFLTLSGSLLGYSGFGFLQLIKRLVDIGAK